MKTVLNVEYQGVKTDCGGFEDKAKEAWKQEGGLVKDIKTMELYFKPEENMCYYVINGLKSGRFNA